MAAYIKDVILFESLDAGHGSELFRAWELGLHLWLLVVMRVLEPEDLYLPSVNNK
jgi:hypothetical protein